MAASSYSRATEYRYPNYLCIRSYLGFLINVDQLLLILAADIPKRAEPCTLPRTSENPHGYPSLKGKFQVDPPSLTSICRGQAEPQGYIILVIPQNKKGILRCREWNHGLILKRHQSERMFQGRPRSSASGSLTQKLKLTRAPAVNPSVWRYSLFKSVTFPNDSWH